jgi:hypothetical protein
MKAKLFYGLVVIAAAIAVYAALMPITLTYDDSAGHIPLERKLVASNGITVITNFVLKAMDGSGTWKLVVTNATGTIATVTNN